jgi:hypothetical protein
MTECPHQGLQLFFVQVRRHRKPDLDSTDPGRIPYDLPFHLNLQPFRRQVSGIEELGRIVPDAGAKGSQQKLRRGHAHIGAAVEFRLV